MSDTQTHCNALHNFHYVNECAGGFGTGTSELSTRLDDLGALLARVLLDLRHALTGHLIGLAGGTHSDLVLYCAQGRQARCARTVGWIDRQHTSNSIRKCENKQDTCYYIIC